MSARKHLKTAADKLAGEVTAEKTSSYKPSSWQGVIGVSDPSVNEDSSTYHALMTFIRLPVVECRNSVSR